MTSIRNTVADRLANYVMTPANNRSNDYEYTSGWNGELMGQQTRFNAAETRKLVAALEAEFPDEGERREALQILSELTTSDPAIGGVAFRSVEAAEIMTQAARAVDAGIRFGASRTSPFHPAG